MEDKTKQTVNVSRLVRVDGRLHRLYNPRADVVEAILKRGEPDRAKMAMGSSWACLQALAGLLKGQL